MKAVPATAWRLGGAFCAVLALFGAALLVTLQTLDRLEAAEREVAGLEEAKHAGHYAAAFVREQYIHQAHTIINGDDSHLGHYERAVAETRAAVDHLLEMARTPEQQSRAVEISRLAQESDIEFRQNMIPAIRNQDATMIRRLHDRAGGVREPRPRVAAERGGAFVSMLALASILPGCPAAGHEEVLRVRRELTAWLAAGRGGPFLGLEPIFPGLLVSVAVLAPGIRRAGRPERAR